MTNNLNLEGLKMPVPEHREFIKNSFRIYKSQLNEKHYYVG